MISFDFSLQRWMVGFWYYIEDKKLHIYIDIGPFEWLIGFKRSKS